MYNIHGLWFGLVTSWSDWNGFGNNSGVCTVCATVACVCFSSKLHVKNVEFDSKLLNFAAFVFSLNWCVALNWNCTNLLLSKREATPTKTPLDSSISVLLNGCFVVIILSPSFVVMPATWNGENHFRFLILWLHVERHSATS